MHYSFVNVIRLYYIICFFFSSRRRHTRWNCDWSSDVCSSDLPVAHIPTMSCILQNGTWVELNSLIPTNSGFNLNLSVPVSINDAGQILIDIKTASGNYIHNVLLTPTR